MENKFLKIMVSVLLVVCIINSVKLYKIESRVNEPYGTIEELIKIKYVTGNSFFTYLITKPQITEISEEEFKEKGFPQKDEKPFPHIIGYKDFDGNRKYLANPISHEAVETYYYAIYQENIP